ncbi:mobile element protein [Desulfocucumis palustris]|uniref:Mobile element protein n=2 Tax=Desulfocucumis palustris TaxID=1898651 RepID=A0A2L2XBC8_9FIRM|nr:mobile element protein [Desulfocucumis palustris]
MLYDKVSDREAEERAKFDLRWKVALELPMDEAGFDFTSLCKFRTAIIVNDKISVVFDKIIKMAIEAEILPKDLEQVIDSTSVMGAGAVQDTYTLIQKAMRKVIKTTKRFPQVRKLTASFKQDYLKKGKPEINWDSKEERKKMLKELVSDANSLIEALKENDLNKWEQEAADMLSQVAYQDIEINDQQEPEIRQGVAKDRIISIADSEMRHGHKTSKGLFNGYKDTILEDPHAEIITSVAVSEGNKHDAEVINEVLNGAKSIGISTTQLTGDTAYGSAETRLALQGEQIKVIAPVANPSNKGLFPKSQFTINLDKFSCQCPNQYVTRLCTRDRITKAIKSFRFPEEVCQSCPLRPLCTNSKHGRVVSVHQHEAVLQEAREYQMTREFQDKYRLRPIVERKIAELKHHGLGKARYRGKAKVLFQLTWTSAVVNLKRLFRMSDNNYALAKTLGLCTPI